MARALVDPIPFGGGTPAPAPTRRANPRRVARCPAALWVGPPGLDVWVEPLVVHLAGEIDAATTPTLRRSIERCDRDPSIAAIDLSEVTFFSAAGVRAFTEAGWPSRPHVDIIASPIVRRVLALCDLDFLLDRHGWRDPALDPAVRRSSGAVGFGEVSTPPGSGSGSVRIVSDGPGRERPLWPIADPAAAERVQPACGISGPATSVVSHTARRPSPRRVAREEAGGFQMDGDEARRDSNDAEMIARRALGAAMNSMWGDGGVPPLPSVDPKLVEEARAVLQAQVPDGPELRCALDLLDRCSERAMGTLGTSNAD